MPSSMVRKAYSYINSPLKQIVMFKTKISSLILGLTLVTTFSCEKAKFENLNNSENQITNKKVPANNADVALIEAFVQNKEDFNIDICLYDATKALLKVIADKSHEQVIYKLAAQKNFEPVSFSEIVAVEPQILVVIDNYLNTSALGNYKNLKALTNKMVYQKVDYYPMVTVSRLDATNATAPSLVAAGIEIGENDEIMGWSGANGYAEVIPVSEAMATESQVPVLIVTNGTDYIEDGDQAMKNTHVHTTTVEDKHVSATERGFSISEYRINSGYRFEGGSSSTELKINRTAHAHFPNLSTINVGLTTSMLVDSKMDVANIAPLNVNASTNFMPEPDVVVQHQETSLTDLFNIFWMTAYEHDWYVTDKKVVSIHSNTLQHKLAMKYSGEWYYLFPEIQHAAFPVGIGGAVVYSNYKSRFVVYRNS